MGKLFSSSSDGLKDTGILVLRLMLGSVMFAHGASKIFGIWGGKGLSETVQMMSPGFGSFLPYLSIFTEFLGGAFLILGLVTRFWGIGVTINMAVAVLAVHLKNGFIGQGAFEFPLTLLAIALAITIMGPGAFSLDAALFRSADRLVPQKIASMRDAARRTSKPLAA